VKSTTVSAVLAAAVAAAIVLGVAHADQTSTRPQLGTGSVTVEGDVSVKGDVRVVNDVNARQSGPWNVGVNGIVTTSPQALPFVRVSQTYVITWADRSVDVVAPRELFGSWARIDSVGARTRWINLAAALSIEEKSGGSQARR
jgi:hypothetical protein